MAKKKAALKVKVPKPRPPVAPTDHYVVMIPVTALARANSIQQDVATQLGLHCRVVRLTHKEFCKFYVCAAEGPKPRLWLIRGGQS